MAPNPRRQRDKEARRPKLVVYATLVRRSWLRRTIRLSGESSALIEYDARLAGLGNPQAIVRVDGMEVARVSRMRDESQIEGENTPLPLERHQFTFMIPARRGPISASLIGDVTGHDRLLVQLIYLRLKIAGVRLYEEEGEERFIALPPNKPIPVAGPSPDTLAHPIPSAVDADALGECEAQSPRPTTPISAPPDSPWWKWWGRR